MMNKNADESSLDFKDIKSSIENKSQKSSTSKSSPSKH